MTGKQQYIAHFDLDSFFVSVEVLNNPSLKDQPVIVGGSRERGVVAACSYAARKFGIHSAMPVRKALQCCPQLIIVRGTRSEYSKFSRWVTDIIAAKAPLFEKASIDEFYLDLTGMDKYFDVFQWTIDLRQEIIDKTQLPISFGLASTKLIAKIATDEAKPNGYLFVRPGMEKEFLAPLPVGKIPGVGEQTISILQTMGIHFIRDIYNCSPAVLEEKLGKSGTDLWNKTQAKHAGRIVPFHEAKSISTENTFEQNTADTEFLLSELVRMTEKISFELRKNALLAACIAVKIRYPDFTTTSRQTTLPPTFQDDKLIPVVLELFRKLYLQKKPVRLLGVRLSEFSHQEVQGNLFEDTEKKSKLYQAIDDVKSRYGRTSVQKARVVKKNS